MLPQPQVIIPHPPQLDIPKYIPDYSSQIISRPRLGSSSFFDDISHLVSSSVSPTQSDSPSDTVDEDHIPSPLSPPGGSGNYHYVHRGSGSFDSPISPTEMYENGPSRASYSTSSHIYQSAASASQNSYTISPGSALRDSDAAGPYLSDSPSPVDTNPTSSFPHPLNAAHAQDHFIQPASSYQTEVGGDRFNQPAHSFSRYPRQALEKYSSGNSSHSQNALPDHRRMSDPAVLANPTAYPPASSPDTGAAGRYQQYPFAFNAPTVASPRSPSSYAPSLHRGASMGSLRDLRHHHQHLEYSTSHSQSNTSGWKQEVDSHHHLESFHSSGGLDEPISPLQPNFSGGLGGSPTVGLQYSPIAEDPYGSSPPGTGTSTSSNGRGALNINRGPSHSRPHFGQRSGSAGNSPIESSNNSKTYSFVALPGNAVKKRPRRRYDEIERLYQCSWPDCSKAYGTLNHLNAHVTMQKHGSKRSPNEFKELRKQWRKAKKESESPVAGHMRRGSMSMRREDYDSHRYGLHHYHHSSHQRQHSHHAGQGPPTSIPVPNMGSDGRYAVPVDDIRYKGSERDNQPLEYGANVRQRYGGGAPASWHSGASSSSRSSLHHAYLSSSLPSHSSLPHPHNSHHHHPNLSLQIPSSIQSRPLSQTQPLPSPSHVPMNRLPADSTLLTPLPGYEPPNLLPPLQLGGELTYSTDGYDIYEDNGSGKPSTGHTSLSRGNADEY